MKMAFPAAGTLNTRGALGGSRLRTVIYLRDVLRELVIRDIKIRYKRSMLGIGWSLLNPLLQLSVYYSVFRWILVVKVANFAVFLFIGILVWNWFQSSVFFASAAITDNSMLIRQPGFPVAILPVVTVTSNLVNLVLAFPILLFALLINGFSLTLAVLVLPLVLATQFMLTLTIAYLVAALQVPYRDTQYLLGIFLLLGLYLCPVFYSSEVLPAHVIPFYRLNPLARIIESYRDILMYGRVPSLSAMALTIAALVPLLMLTYTYFRRASYRFIEET